MLENDLDIDICIDIETDSFDIDIGGDAFQTRYIKPVVDPNINGNCLKYSYASKLAADIDVSKNTRNYIFVDGKFYFGDFIEALVVKHNIVCKTMTVATLSLNQNNVDSFKNILEAGYVDKLNLIVSHYFYSHERNNLIKYIYDKLDEGDNFQLIVTRSHCKICLFEAYDGRKIVMHGSANLRSSENIEQIMIEENEELYDFNYEYMKNYFYRYKTIDYGGSK